MRLRTLIELFTELEKVHDDLELLVIDPTHPVGETASRWTPDFLPYITEAVSESGKSQRVGLLLPKPNIATMVDAEGNEFQPLGA